MKTRTKKPAKVGLTKNSVDGEEQDNPSQVLESVTQPPGLVILPKNISDRARIVDLPRPTNTKQTSRYLLCPDRGCYEFITIGDDKACQSWLITPPEITASDSSQCGDQDKAFVLEKPLLSIATPLETLFLLLPMMVAADLECPGMYRTLSDILYDDATAHWQALRQLLSDEQWRPLLQRLEHSVSAVADTLQLGEDEDISYRLSAAKLSDYLLRKAMKAAQSSFPASLEDRFVKQAVEIPTVEESIGVETAPDPLPQSQLCDQSKTSSQTSVSADTPAESISTAATSFSSTSTPEVSANTDVQRLLRIRTTFEFMLRSYVPKELHSQINDSLKKCKSIVDFQPLVQLEALVASKRLEIQALRTLSDNISRKRKFDDEETADKAEEKRRKKEDEETRKKSMSQGVKKLMKADTSGMKKLSSFFTKKAAT